MLLSKLSTYSERLLKTGLILLLLFMAVYGAYFHLRMIGAPGAQEYREGAIIATTQLLLDGQSPYDLENLPQFTHVYGIVYNIVAYPFASIFGSNYTVHRALNAVFLIASAFVLFLFLRENGIERLLSAFGAVSFYFLLVSSYVTVARPDALGLLLFLLSLYLPFRYGYETRILLLSGFIGMLAFYTKPYFILFLPIQTFYLFVSVSKRTGLFYGTGWAFSILVSVFFIHWIEPYYWHCTYFINASSTAADPTHLIDQSNLFIYLHLGFILSMFTRSVFDVWDRYGSKSKKKNPPTIWSLDILGWNNPLFVGEKTNLFAVGFLVSLCALGFHLGWNKGAWMIYFFELLTPFLIVFSLSDLKADGRNRLLIIFAFLLLNGLILARMHPVIIRDQTDNLAQWNTFIKDQDKVFAPAPLVHLLLANGKTIYDAGQAEYFKFGLKSDDPDLLQNPAYVRLRTYVKDLREKLNEGYFDTVLLTQGFEMEFFSVSQLRSHYRFKEIGYLPGYYSGQVTRNEFSIWAIEIWEKKS